MSRILVTGGTGFIGRALVRALAGDHEVVALTRADGDIAHRDTLERAGTVDHVFHLAARTFVPDSWQDPAGFIAANVGGTANVLEYCHRTSASLTFVSAYVYGPPERLPIAEGTPPRPNNPYALSKHLAEQACAFYACHRGVRVTVIRPFNVYGPGQSAHFLIPRIVEQVQARTEIRVLDLHPKRDYVFLDDLVDALVRTLAPGEELHRVFNIGSGESVSVQAVIDTIQQVAGTALPVTDAGERRVQELDDVRADITRARTQLGWTPRTPLRDGIARMLPTGDQPQ